VLIATGLEGHIPTTSHSRPFYSTSMSAVRTTVQSSTHAPKSGQRWKTGASSAAQVLANHVVWRATLTLRRATESLRQVRWTLYTTASINHVQANFIAMVYKNISDDVSGIWFRSELSPLLSRAASHFGHLLVPAPIPSSHVCLSQQHLSQSQVLGTISSLRHLERDMSPYKQSAGSPFLDLPGGKHNRAGSVRQSLS
jgi:hypothetical protein